MKEFLQRVSSRKFLTALAVQVVAVIAIFNPGQEDAMTDAALRIVGLIVLLLAAIGYGAIEAGVDKANKPPDIIVTDGEPEEGEVPQE